MTPQDWIGIASTVATLGVAVWGLRTWFRQLRGTTKYQLALKVLRLVYRLRDEIRRCRSYLVVPVGKEGEPESLSLVQERSVYQGRIRRLLTSDRNLETLELETAAVWGEGINACLQALHKKVERLMTAADVYFSLVHLGESVKPQCDKAYAELYGKADDKDVFWNEVLADVRTAEATFREFVK